MEEKREGAKGADKYMARSFSFSYLIHESLFINSFFVWM
jgi:hypothetical protein